MSINVIQRIVGQMIMDANQLIVICWTGRLPDNRLGTQPCLTFLQNQ